MNVIKSSTNVAELIRVYDVEFPPNFLNELIAEYETDFQCATVGANDETNTAVRRCFVAGIDTKSSRRAELDNVIFQQVTAVLERYRRDFNDSKCTTDCGYTLIKYEVGGFYREHTDYSVVGKPRIVSMSIQMNDGFEGGKFAFFGGTHVVQQKQNQAICFPSNFMFPHAITPVTSGVRYAIVTWAY